MNTPPPFPARPPRHQISDTSPPWPDDARPPVFPRIERDLEVDTIVVGGGITGLTAAYLLKRAGRSVAVLERGRCARVDTGHTTAHLTAVTDARWHDLLRDFGAEGARAVWDAGMAAIAWIAGTVAREGIECDFHRVDGVLHTPFVDSGADHAAAMLQTAPKSRR